MTPEEHREYSRQWRKARRGRTDHVKRGVGSYVCPVCGRRDTADGSVRAQSGLCLDCWCARENRRTDARLRERIEDLKARREARGDDLRDFHRGGTCEYAKPSEDERLRRKRRNREYHRRWCAAHREQLRAVNRRYYLAHREECMARSMAWERAHPDAVREHNRRKYLKRKQRQQQKGEER